MNFPRANQIFWWKPKIPNTFLRPARRADLVSTPRLTAPFLNILADSPARLCTAVENVRGPHLWRLRRQATQDFCSSAGVAPKSINASAIRVQTRSHVGASSLRGRSGRRDTRIAPARFPGEKARRHVGRARILARQVAEGWRRMYTGPGMNPGLPASAPDFWRTAISRADRGFCPAAGGRRKIQFRGKKRRGASGCAA